MSQSPARSPVPLREVQPGKFFESIVRPPLARPALPYRVEFGHVHIVDACKGQHGIQPHQHAHYELLLIQSGEYRCLINDLEVHISAGGLIIIAPGD